MRRSAHAGRSLLWFSVVAFLGTSPGLLAQIQSPSKPTGFNLEQTLAAASTNYPLIRVFQAEQRAAENFIEVARTAYLPRTDILWQIDRGTANNVLGLLLPQATIPSVTGSILPSDSTRSAWNSAGGALVSWQPFDFGARGAKLDAARKGSQASKEAATLTQLQVTTAAGSAFFDLAAAEQVMLVARANLQRYELFDKVVHVLVDNTLRPGADASQADAQLALARNQLIQIETQASVRRVALAQYLQARTAEVEIDADVLLSSIPDADLEVEAPSGHPLILKEQALDLQEQAQKRFLDRSYVPVFSTSGVVFGRGAGTSSTGNFPGGTAGLAPDTLNWAAGFQVSFAAFDYFNLRGQRRVQEAKVQAEHARLNQALSDVNTAVQQAEATLTGARRLMGNTPLELTAAKAGEQQQQARYRSGLSSVVDVAAAEAVLAQAEGDDAMARLGVWRAELGVAAAQGDLQPFIQLLQSQTKGK